MKNLLNNKFLQFTTESILIIGISFLAFKFIPNLPWWTVAVFGGIGAFVLNTNVKSFATGFTAIAVFWGFLAFQLNAANLDLLAGKVGEMLSANETISNLGGLNSTRLIYLTAILGGLIGGLGGMTGNYARKAFVKKRN